MPEQNLQAALEARVRRIEATNRRLVAGAGIACCFVLAGAAQSPAPAEVVRASRVEIVNEAGTVQVRMGVGADGPEIELLDTAGVARATLGHGSEGTVLYLKDAAGTTRIGVAQFAHGGGGFALHGEEARGAAVLYLKGGRGTLTFFDADGKVVSQVPREP